MNARDDHDHGRPRAVDVTGEASRGLRGLGAGLLVVGALLLSAGAWLLLRPKQAAPAPELARALELSAAGRLDEAEALIEHALESRPGDVTLLTELGWMRLSRGDAERALEPLEAAAAVAPQTPGLQSDLAAAYLALERGEDALAAALRATEEAPDNAAAWLYRGRALYQLGRLEEGLPAVRAARDLAPGDAGITSELAQALLVAGRGAEALVEFERLCELLPERWEPRVDLANLCLDQGDRERARRALDEARALAPDEPAVQALAAELDAGG